MPYQNKDGENKEGFEKMMWGSGVSRMILLGSIFLAVLIAYFAVSVWRLAGAPKEGEFPRQLTVAGEGKVTIKPDIAVFTMGVVTNAKKVKDAQAENTAKYNQALAFLKKQGIEEKDIKTIEYNVYPQYGNYPPPCVSGLSYPCPEVRPPEILSYQVRQTLEVKVRDLEKIDDVLDGVVSSGANEVGALSFRIDDPEVVRAEARKKAIEDAKAKARILADDLGVRLKKIVSYNDGYGGYYPAPYATADFGKGGGFAGATLERASAPDVQPGEQEVVSNVSIVYEFR